MVTKNLKYYYMDASGEYIIKKKCIMKYDFEKAIGM